MDLLGGYSSSSSDDEDSVADKPPQIEPQPAAPSTRKTKKTGTKILSLSSVLPRHILEQLTASGAGDGNIMDDDDDDFVEKSQKKKQAPAPTKSGGGGRKAKFLNHASSAATEDAGLSSFLSELSSMSSKSAPKILAPSESNSASKSSSLGSAFLASTTTTVIKKKGKSEEIRDIHGGDSEARGGPEINDVHEQENAHPMPAPTAARAAPAIRVAPRIRAAPMTSRGSAEAAASYPAPHQAAASYPAAPQHAAAYHSSRQATAAAYPTSRQSATAYPTPAPQSQTNSKKSRRRQMEQMLRAGNVAGIEGDVHMDAPSKDLYAPVPQTHREPLPQGHGIHGASVANMYDHGGKQKSKSQLTALLGNAAALERQRLRDAEFGMGKTTQTTHRVNAKRKYGW